MTLRRVIRSFRGEAALAGVAYVSLLVFARPDIAAALFDIPQWPWANRLFAIGLAVALAALGCLAIKLWGRLVAAGQRITVPVEGRATSGTVMAEFALVFPVVLLVMCMIIQLALIANATLVVRYAAFSAARSAIVSFEADTHSEIQVTPSWLPTYVQFPPWPEWVDRERPERAARLTLASISPKTRLGSGPAARSFERLLQRQGGTWQGRNFASRYAYAAAATRVETIRDTYGPFLGYYESYPPLIPRSEHLITPYGLSQGDDQFYVPVPPPPRIPGSITIPIPPINVSIGPISFPLPLPIPSIRVPLPSAIVDPINRAVRRVFNVVRGGSVQAVDRFTSSPLNIDSFSPKEVEIKVEHDFLLTLPGLNFVPGMTTAAPVGRGRAFTIRHSVRLQSTGTRKANQLAFFPFPENMRKGAFRENWFFYWVWP